ncbi:beta-3-deoxy-D-manno-oct-2-ulosonic acid transferase [Microbulbifer sp. A4B17]|uniref:capsular polysaccharide biosynthesis protein n=1 Tax=Microbulbifer sp. A4B17 TaxID=359370 RepID=UPI000D52DABA|nr:capsular polysaccharide biosynthesis protein [Microbulbifer sp. A4B17]AWF80110.1 beta-3-deoxy-D-manno-oct-2-ulosonic acid transferase [Microbulbifer sp. A4B17]
MSVVGHCSLGLSRLKVLESFLGARCQYVALQPDSCINYMIGWGLKPTAMRAKRVSSKAGLPFVCIEDGFIRSLGLGVDGAVPHSLVLDKTGIYYDASRPSDLEALISHADFTPAELKRAEKGLELLRSNRLCKYNQSLDAPLGWPKNLKRVLVVDQTFGDVSIRAGQASEAHFKNMLESAIEDNPEAEICVKVHPDVIAGKKRGYLLGLASEKGCRIINEDVSPWAIFDCVEKVYVVTSQLGFDALIAGKEVHCFGIPFYSGWGLTKDRQYLPRRNTNRSLPQLFCAAYLRYCRYINPYTGDKCEFEDTLALIAEQKRQWLRFEGPWVGVGFSPWKKRFIPNFLGDKRKVNFVKNKSPLKHCPEGSNVFVWASRVTDSLRENVERAKARLWRVEDGFLRSAGLGADLVAPTSLVFDARGIYFDARSPSDLEVILNDTNFSDLTLDKARDLHSLLLNKRVTKYNIKGKVNLSLSDNKKVILVPGQVESDASIACGSPVIKSNHSLLERVRGEHPNAHIIYKPHPDVVAGARLGDLPQGSQCFYDSLVTEGDVSQLLEQVDEVHTLSSLTGFEALLRGVKVVTYGLPFYSGWGLTHDTLLSLTREDCSNYELFKNRRHRRLTLNELIAGTLLLYPVYTDIKTGDYVDAQTTVKLLEKQRSLYTNKNILFKVFYWYRRKFLRY